VKLTEKHKINFPQIKQINVPAGNRGYNLRKFAKRSACSAGKKILSSSGFFFSFIFLGIMFFVASCNPAKHIPPNDALYSGATILIDSTKLTGKQKKKLSKNLIALTRPKPNSKFLGVYMKLFFYNLAYYAKKNNSPRGWVKNHLGEPPVLASDVNIDHNSKVLQSYLENKGHFIAEVSGDTTIKHKKAQAIYHAQPGVRYRINEIVLQKDSSALTKEIVADFSETLLKKGDAFDLDIIKAERDRIDADLKENGFFFFNPEFLIIQVDSNLGNHTVNLYINVKQQTPLQARRTYDINNVYIYANFSLKSSAADTAKQDAIQYKNFYLVDSGKLFRPALFDEAMRFQPGDTYTRSDHNLTISRLINSGLFKFVKNRFELVNVADTPMLNTYYYLTPLPKKSLQFQVMGTSKSDNLVGSQVTVGWKDRNLFGGGELLSIDVHGGFEVQYSSDLNGYNTYSAGLDNKLSFPRFIIPFTTINTAGAFLPKTNIEIGYDFLNKIRLYTLNSFRFSYGYDWKENAHKEHVLNPIAITYVQPLNVTQEYKDSAIDNPALNYAIQKQFILGSNYTFTFNQLNGKQPVNAFYLNENVDVSGNVAGLISGANAKAGKIIYLFGLDFSQYVKTETDFRYYHNMGNSTWANRIDVGVGIPYGNSTALPFIKQFFAGGTNDIRAFPSRSVGPGIFQDTTDKNFLPDESGDIKLEFNTELRAKLFSIVNGAIFVDAGNVWLFNTDTLHPGGQFTSGFMKQLAVGAGVGLRFDISILLIRLDVAFPLRIPYLPDGHRWVIDQINFGSGDWRRNNLVYNLGIGYPF
jgi:outer membrane protein insertion porin family